MAEAGVTLTRGLPENLMAPAARLYLEAFSAKLRPLLGRGERAERFLVSVMAPDRAVAALDGAGGLVGLAGFNDADGGFIGGGWRELARVYGLPGGWLRNLAFAAFEQTPEAGQFLMDGVVVAPAARGRGVGAGLVGMIEDEARARGYAAVRLDVVDANIRARALYERLGYRPAGAISLGPVGRLVGLRRATTMIKPLDAAPRRREVVGG